MHRFDLVYIWFADYHSFFPTLIAKLFGRKVVVVVGGQDAVSIPSIQFGVFLKNGFRAFCAKQTYKLADLILPVDDSLIMSKNTYADPTGIGYQCGIAFFVPDLNTPIVVLPTGYDDQKWRATKNVEKNPDVITIGGAPDMQTFKRKGLDLFIDIAALVPETQFYIIGLKGEMETFAKGIATKNVNFLGYLPNEELPELLSKFKVFAQFSMSEGLPNTLCEAMLCECIPVGTAVNGIPKGIGEHGFILKGKNLVEAALLLKKALVSDRKIGVNARKHIQKHFSLKEREERLISLISNL